MKRLTELAAFPETLCRKTQRTTGAPQVLSWTRSGDRHSPESAGGSTPIPTEVHVWMNSPESR